MKNSLIKSTFALVAIVVLGSTAFSEVSGYGGSSSGTRVTNRTPVGLVLGAATTTATTTAFVFNTDLRIGSQNSDVMELQKRLRAEGFFTFPTDTGYFGPITLAAVKAYQAAHPEIGYVTGFCGPLTRAVLNK